MVVTVGLDPKKGGSGGRKPEVFIRVVPDGCGRERKPRIVTLLVPEAYLTKFLANARPQGRARQRVKRKGRGSIERRKIARRGRSMKDGKGMSAAAEVSKLSRAARQHFRRVGTFQRCLSSRRSSR